MTGKEWRIDRPTAAPVDTRLRGALYAAFIGSEVCRAGAGLLDRWRTPDAPEAERMADVAVGALRAALPWLDSGAISVAPEVDEIRLLLNLPWKRSAREVLDAARWWIAANVRAPDQPAPLAVGEVVSSGADLDQRASVGTIVEEQPGHDFEGLVAVLVEPGRWTPDTFSFPVVVVRAGGGGHG